MFETTTYEHNLLARASLDQCVKCTICESACPVLRVTPAFSGPKYVGPQAERYRGGLSVDHTLDYCSSCGTCTLVCPQGVKIAELNSVARAAMKKDHMPLRDKLIGRTTLMGQVMTPVAPIANWVLNLKPARVVMEGVIGIHRDAPMPTAQHHNFDYWLRRRPEDIKEHGQEFAPGQSRGSRGPVIFFHGCAGGYFEVETSIKTVELLEWLGFQVIVPKQGCCGLAMQSNGVFDDARKTIRKTAAELLGSDAPAGTPIISSSGSCTGMFKHEAREIMGVEDDTVTEVGTRIRDICEFLLDLAEDGELPTDLLQPIDMKVAYHAPCQLKGQGMGKPALPLLRMIPKLEVVESTATCCGIAGTYGLKKEKYEVAQAVGKPLFDLVKQTNPQLAVCDTETCRWQIAKSTGAKVVSPVWMLHKSFGLS
jgi:glycerol-3-phosphate dehydrogenase subunit C